MIINHQLRQNVMIIVTLLLGMLLTVIPLPAWAIAARPEWVWVVLIFWLIYTPQKIGPGIAWCIGLYTDLLLGTVLGEHALLFVLAAYVIQRFLSFVRALPFWQKLLGLGLLTAASIIVKGLLLQFLAIAEFHGMLLLPTVTTMLVWPFLYMLCRNPKAAYDYRLTRVR